MAFTPQFFFHATVKPSVVYHGLAPAFASFVGFVLGFFLRFVKAGAVKALQG